MLKHATRFSCLWLILTLQVCCEHVIENEWAVEIQATDGKDVERIALDIADKYDMEITRMISREHMPEYVILQKMNPEIDDEDLHVYLSNEEQVKWVKKQEINYEELKGTNDAADIRNMKFKNKYMDITACHCHNVTSSGDTSIPSYVFNSENILEEKNYRKKYNDYRWPCQWELYNCGQTNGPKGFDMDVTKLWDKGYTGKGVVVAVVDSGVDFHQIDLRSNYLPSASIDLTEYPDLNGPLPVWHESHGTSCAGLIAMEANNGYCGVGISHGVKFGAIRMMGHGHTTDAREAAAFIYRANLIDVSSNSWGPKDTGYYYGGPKRLTKIALERGAKKGRRGRGVIYTHASGNGGHVDDSCGADGYTCSIYTISATSITNNGQSVYFTEPCSCVMVGVPQEDVHVNSFYVNLNKMVTLHNTKGCIMGFSGTSAATPMVSAGAALVLQVNPNLTWRDMQYLIANTSRVTDPTSHLWHINGAGYKLHRKMGFGTMDVLRMAAMAETWTTVDEQHNCTLHFKNAVSTIPSNGILRLTARSDGCKGSGHQVLQLEHVQAILSYKVKCRGDIGLRLRSPCGTWSELMTPRKNDFYTTLINWPYMSVHNWGEDPRGEWVLEITDHKNHASICERASSEKSAGTLLSYKLILYGVSAEHRSNHVGCTGRTQLFKKLRNDAKNSGTSYGKYLLKLSDKQLTKSVLDFMFVEEFRKASIEEDAKKISKAPPVKYKKPRSLSIPIQSYIMKQWKQDFINQEEMAKSLLDYALFNKYPNSISKKDFKVVRCIVSKDLLLNPISAHDGEDLDDVEYSDAIGKSFADMLLFGVDEKHKRYLPLHDRELAGILAHVLEDRSFKNSCADDTLSLLDE